MKKSALISALFLALPLVASAQTAAPLSNVQNLVRTAGNIIGSLIPILIAIAMIVFFWGLIKYIRGSGEGHEEGKKIMIAGLVSLFIMVCVWGIVIFAANALGIQAGTTAPAPGIPGYSGSGGFNTTTGTCNTPGLYGPGC
jgi:hypothetical protein